MPARVDAPGVRACGTVRSYGRTIAVYITRGAKKITCEHARRHMAGPRLHPVAGWAYHDWGTVRSGPWTDVMWRERDRAIVLAGIDPATTRRMSLVARAVLLLAGLSALVGCGSTTGSRGGGGASTAARRPSPPPPPRAPIRILAPAHAGPVTGQPIGHRLRALVALAGRAAAGQQLALRAACADAVCEGIAFTDAHGRWHARLAVTASGSRRTVALAVAYAAPGPASARRR